MRHTLLSFHLRMFGVVAVSLALPIVGCAMIMNDPFSHATYTLSYAQNWPIYTQGTSILSNTAIFSGGTATYSITPSLSPVGLSLNSATGTISGTPSANTGVAFNTYTVTATTSRGSATTTLDLMVQPTGSGTINVNSTAPSAWTGPGCLAVNGFCTLPAAITWAMKSSGQQAVVIPNGTYPLSTFSPITIDNGASVGGGTLTALVLAGQSQAGTVITGNTSSAGGLFNIGVSANPEVSLALSNLTVESANSTNANDGGVLYFGPTHTAGLSLNISGVRFYNNSSMGVGGAVAVEGSVPLTASIDQTIFDTNAYISNGFSVEDGGGGLGLFMAAGSTASVTHSYFVDNTATGSGSDSGLGGAFYIASYVGTPGAISVSSCTFVDNQALGTNAYGGAINLTVGSGNPFTVNFTNVTGFGNSAATDGGFLYTQGGGGTHQPVANLSYATIVNNTTSNAGFSGGISVATGNVTVTNSLISNNSAVGVAANVGNTDICTSGGFNLYDNLVPTHTCGSTGSDAAKSLASIATASATVNNGGLVPTLALEAGSFALDMIPAASCGGVLLDARGNTRPDANDRCDPGAYQH